MVDVAREQDGLDSEETGIMNGWHKGCSIYIENRRPTFEQSKG
jgi:hypothetical protein